MEDAIPNSPAYPGVAATWRRCLSRNVEEQWRRGGAPVLRNLAIPIHRRRFTRVRLEPHFRWPQHRPLPVVLIYLRALPSVARSLTHSLTAEAKATGAGARRYDDETLLLRGGIPDCDASPTDDDRMALVEHRCRDTLGSPSKRNGGIPAAKAVVVIRKVRSRKRSHVEVIRNDRAPRRTYRSISL